MPPLRRSSAPPTAQRVLAFGGVITMAIWSSYANPAVAQETIYIGGSGQPSVEVNLDALNDLDAYADGRLLLHPGEKPLYLRRSTPPRVYGSDIFRVPAPASSPSRRAAAPSRQAEPWSPPAPSLAPPAERPLIAAKPPTPVEAPSLTPLPELSPKPVRRAVAKPPQPLPERSVPRAPVPPHLITEGSTPSVPSSRDQKRLSELAALRGDGLITDDDYAAKRSQIVEKTPANSAQARLKELAALRDEALISKSDYEAKRAEILGTTPTAPVASPPAIEAVAPAPVAPSKPPPAASPAKPETRVAAVPKRPVPSGGAQQLRLEFTAGSASISPAQLDQLKELGSRLESSSDRVQIRSYAGAEGEDTGTARRISLKRALAVRSSLIEQNIRSTRIDVRALGIVGEGPANRVDILTVVR